jgi:hypothetical protein
MGVKTIYLYKSTHQYFLAIQHDLVLEFVSKSVVGCLIWTLFK